MSEPGPPPLAPRPAATPPPPTGSGGPVRYEVAGAVATVVLDRPSVGNALDLAAKRALLQALRAAAADEAVRCVVLTGAGRAFCVGQDLREHARLLDDGDGDSAAQLGSTVAEHYNPIATLLATMPKPVLAAVNGVAAGAGAAFAMACDLRLLGESGGFNLAFAGIGLSCDSGSSWWLPRLVGPARAKELLLLPRTVGAEESLRLGLASRVVPDADLAAETSALARRLAEGPTLAYASIRRAVAASLGLDLAAALEQEAALMALTGASEDHRRAVHDFLAKRAPHFSGR